MEGTNGIETAQRLRAADPDLLIVFVTSSPEYVWDAFPVHPFDYLLKPYQPEELKQIIDRVRQKRDTNVQNFEQSMRRLLSDGCKFALQTMTSLLLLRCTEILLFRYLDDTRCWQVTLTNMEQHRLRMTIKAKEILNLSQSFVRINSNCILNIEYLSSIENNTLRCVLYSPFEHLELTASRRHFSKIKEMLEML